MLGVFAYPAPHQERGLLPFQQLGMGQEEEDRKLLRAIKKRESPPAAARRVPLGLNPGKGPWLHIKGAAQLKSREKSSFCQQVAC